MYARQRRNGLGFISISDATKAPGFIKGLTRTPSHVRMVGTLATLVPRAIAGDAAAYAEIERLSRQAATSRSKAMAADALSKVDAARSAAGAVVQKVVDTAGPVVRDAALTYAKQQASNAADSVKPMLLPLAIGAAVLLFLRK